MVNVYEVTLPEYRVDRKPDYKTIGVKLDNAIKSHFPNRWIAVRGISLQDHPGKTRAEVIALIVKNGTDRYDPQRKGVHHEIDEKFDIELHATPMIAKEKICCGHYTEERCPTGSVMAEFIKDCYEGAIVDRGYPLRLDILLIYDLDQLKAAPMKWENNEPVHKDYVTLEETTTYQFKNSNQKKKALLGIVNIM